MSEDRTTISFKDEQVLSSSSNINWINCYNGERIEYLSDGIGCIKCDNYLKFFTEDGTSNYFSNVETGISAFATHKINSIFAFADNIPTPKIFIVRYPTFEIVTELKGEAESLGYAWLEFSSTNFLASISGIPLDELVIWRYTDGTRLYSCKVVNSSKYMLMFNPINPKQFAMCSDKEILIWFMLGDSVQKKHITLPSVKSVEKSLMDEYTYMGGLSTNDFILSLLDLPRSCIVDLMGEDLNEFEEELRSSVKIVPSSLWWSTDGVLFIGCEQGEMFKISDRVVMVPLTYEEVSSVELSSISENISKQVSVLLVHKNFLVVGGKDGMLRFYDLIGTTFKYVDAVNINQKISSIVHVAHQGKMLIGTEDGGIFCIYWANTKKLIEIFNHENSLIIAMGVLPLNTSTYVTLKSTGLVTVWGIDGSVMSSLQLDPRVEATSMSVSSLLNLVVIGTVAGFVYLGNFVTFSAPRWLNKLTIHMKPVVCTRFFKGGKYFALGYEDGYVFIVSGVPSQNFNVVGYIEMGGTMTNMSIFNAEKSQNVGVLFTSGDQQYVTLSSIDKDTLWKKPEYLLTKYQFKKFMTNKVTCPLTSPAIDLVMLGMDTVAFLHTDRSIMSYRVFNYDNLKSSGRSSVEASESPQEEDYETHSISIKASDYYRRDTQSIMTETMKSRRASYIQRRKQSSTKERKESIVFLSFLFPDTKEEDFISELKPLKRYGSHKLQGSHLGLTFDEKFLFSCGQDGTFKIYDLETTEIIFSMRCIDFWEKGINLMTMSFGNRFVVCSGYNKTFACFEVNAQTYEEELSSAQKHKNSFLQMIKNDQHNEHMEFGRLISTSVSHFLDDASLGVLDKSKMLEDIQRSILNDEVYLPIAPRISPSMPWFNRRLFEIMEEEEFICNQFKSLLRARITQLRRVLRKMIKENEEMEGIEKIPHREFDLDLDEQKAAQGLCDAEVQKLKDDRALETKAKKKLIKVIKRECWDDMSIKGRGIKAFLSDTMVHNYPMKERTEEELRELTVASSHRRVEIAEQQMRLKSGENALRMKKSRHSDVRSYKSEDDYEKDDNIFEVRTQNALSGSLAALTGGESELFYPQFEICTKFQKIKQIVLLKDSIHRIKMGFNKEFDAILALKVKNISSIKEKNQRIRKIIKDINSNDNVVDPELNTYEKPELLFFTPDEDVRVEKFLTPEEWKKQEEENKLEEERKLREKKDNWRERGLEKMMGGVLEVKKEDELKKDIPVPAFMVEKGEEKWSDEERQAAASYRLQLKNLEDEREKFKKFQEVELKKLQAFVNDTMQEFDAKVNILISRKILVQSAIYQEALMWFRLKHSILLEEQTNLKEKQMLVQLEDARERSNQKLVTLINARKTLDEYQSIYDTQMEEDRQHERMFKKEFHDVPHNHIENLLKLYKKRPKRPKSRIGDESTHGQQQQQQQQQERQSLSCSDGDCMSYVTNFMAELDGPKNMIEGLSPVVWDQFCRYRHEKVLKELFLRNEASHLVVLQNRVAVLQSKAEKAKQKIEEIFNNINQLHSSRHHFYRNMEVQLLLKQGQVEVEVTDFLPIYRTSLLLHREVVEEVNKNINSLGQNKIATMIESKSFKKEIAQLEWEHKKMEMELQDLKNKMKDVANFKVTKEVLSFLNKDNYDEVKTQEVQTLEKTINLTKEYHKKNLSNKKEKLLAVDNSIKSVRDQNKQMVDDLTQLNDTILERKRIRDVVVEKSGMATSERVKRHNAIVKKSKLSELARNQLQEIKTLKEEIEDLRTKTFPLLPADQKKLL